MPQRPEPFGSEHEKRTPRPPPIEGCIDCTCIDQPGDFTSAVPNGVSFDNDTLLGSAAKNSVNALSNQKASAHSHGRRILPVRASFEVVSGSLSQHRTNGVSPPKAMPSKSLAPNGIDTSLAKNATAPYSSAPLKQANSQSSMRRHSFAVLHPKEESNHRKHSLLESIHDGRVFASRHGSFLDDSFTFDPTINEDKYIPQKRNDTKANIRDLHTPMINGKVDDKTKLVDAEYSEDLRQLDPNKHHWYDLKNSRKTSILTSEFSVRRDDLEPPTTTKYRLYLLFGLFTTTILGVDVATNRYLQNTAGLNGIFIITLRAFAAFIVWLPFLPQFFKKLRTMRFFYLYAFLHSINPPLNTYSVKFTVAYVAQVIKLTSPFFVSGLSYCLKYPIPRYTWPALVVTAIGGFMTIAGDFTGLSVQDAYGSLLSLSNAFVFALNTFMYSILQRDVPSKGLTFLENFLQFCVIGTLSFSIDNWRTVWGEMSQETIIVLGVSLFSSIIGAFGRVACARVIGAPLLSAMAPWELVVTLGLSVSPFLDDRASVINIIGIAIVTITLTLYLYTKYLDSEKLRLDVLAQQRVLKGLDGDLSSSNADEHRDDNNYSQLDTDSSGDKSGIGFPEETSNYRRKISSFFESRKFSRWKKWGSDPTPRNADAYVPLSGVAGDQTLTRQAPL